jgi:hypothetical protein
MVARSNRKLKPLSVGDNVIIPVSEFDRGKGDPLNLLGVVLDTNVSGKEQAHEGSKSAQQNGQN